jgi:hypothetical protein
MRAASSVTIAATTVTAMGVSKCVNQATTHDVPKYKATPTTPKAAANTPRPNQFLVIRMRYSDQLYRLPCWTPENISRSIASNSQTRQTKRSLGALDGALGQRGLEGLDAKGGYFRAANLQGLELTQSTELSQPRIANLRVVQ